MKLQLIQLMQEYLDYGVVMGGELALPSKKALELVNQLEDMGIVITGVDGWYFVDKEKGHLAPDLRIDFSVGDDVLKSASAVNESARLVKEFIKGQHLGKDHLVSLSLDIPYWWDLFSEKGI